MWKHQRDWQKKGMEMVQVLKVPVLRGHSDPSTSTCNFARYLGGENQGTDCTETDTKNTLKPLNVGGKMKNKTEGLRLKTSAKMQLMFIEMESKDHNCQPPNGTNSSSKSSTLSPM